MKRIRSSITSAAVTFVLMIAAFGAGVTFGANPTIVNAQSRLGLFSPQSVDVPDNFTIFWQALDVVQDHFVDQDVLTDENLTYGAIEGLLEALGDQGHTAFLTPEEVAAQRSSIAGSFSGIGATVGMENDLPVIIAPIDGSPAEKAGVLAGDMILKVDNTDISGQDLGMVIDQIRGEAGTEVVLTMLRGDEAGPTTIDIAITRGDIVVPATTWGFIPDTDVALIRLSQFSANAAETITAALEEAQDEGASSVVLDLRNNPGGLVDQAIRVTSQFIDEGNVFQEENASGNRRVIEVLGDGVATDIPLVVLINEGSASSAEILAGAIQDYERGLLIGTTTFGTGTVLQPFNLEDGSAIMLGTRQWLTAEGRLIRKQGIAPDIEVTQEIGADLVSPSELESLTLEELLAGEDLQLQEALKELGIR